MPEETATEEQPKAPAKGGSSPIMKLLLIVLLAIGSSASGGVVSWILISRTLNSVKAAAEKPPAPEKDEATKAAELIEKGGVLPLEPFVVNLADSEASRYLRIKVTLMLDNKTKLKELADNTTLQIKLRDVILQCLTAKSSHDLTNEAGKAALRHELQEKITPYFRDPKLVDVMFTEFVIQL